MPSWKSKTARFINAALLKADGEITAPIDSFYDVELDGDEKTVLKLAGQPKDFVLNTTNGGTIADAYGDEINDWIGKEITLYQDRCSMKGRMVDCVRVRIPKS
jgi:hypothetical protein